MQALEKVTYRHQAQELKTRYSRCNHDLPTSIGGEVFSGIRMSMPKKSDLVSLLAYDL